MHVDPLGDGRFHVAFFDPTEFVDAYTRQIMRGELFLPGEGYPAAGTSCGAVLLFPINNDRVELKGKITRLSADNPKGAHLQLQALPDEVRTGLEAYLTEVLRGEQPPVRFLGSGDQDLSEFDARLLSDDEPDEESEEKTEADEALRYQQHATGAAHKARGIWAQIREMTVQQKIKLALQGGRAARANLIKDPQQVVHQYVLRNPRITMDEITHISGNPASSTEVIRIIASNQQWMADQSVRWNIVKNPKTNTQLAVSYVKQLPISKLNQLAKSQNVKGAISQAAFKLLEAKGKRMH